MNKNTQNLFQRIQHFNQACAVTNECFDIELMEWKLLAIDEQLDFLVWSSLSSFKIKLTTI